MTDEIEQPHTSEGELHHFPTIFRPKHRTGYIRVHRRGEARPVILPYVEEDEDEGENIIRPSTPTPDSVVLAEELNDKRALRKFVENTPAFQALRKTLSTPLDKMTKVLFKDIIQLTLSQEQWISLEGIPRSSSGGNCRKEGEGLVESLNESETKNVILHDWKNHSLDDAWNEIILSSLIRFPQDECDDLPELIEFKHGDDDGDWEKFSPSNDADLNNESTTNYKMQLLKLSPFSGTESGNHDT